MAFLRSRLDYLAPIMYWLVLLVALAGVLSAKLMPGHIDSVALSGICFSLLVLKLIK